MVDSVSEEVQVIDLESMVATERDTFIERSRKDISSDYLNHPDIYQYLTNQNNYPNHDTTPEVISRGVKLYVQFVLDNTQNINGTPEEKMRSALLNSMINYKLADIKPNLWENIRIFLDKDLKNYLSRE